MLGRKSSHFIVFFTFSIGVITDSLELLGNIPNSKDLLTICINLSPFLSQLSNIMLLFIQLQSDFLFNSLHTTFISFSFIAQNLNLMSMTAILFSYYTNSMELFISLILLIKYLLNSLAICILPL